MPLKDLMQNQLSAADLSDMNKSLDQLQAAINGKMVNLTPEERQKYGSINEQNKLLVNKVNDLHTSQPNFDSSKVNWVEFESDFATRAQLEGIITRLRSIAEQLDDTKILHDNDNYQAALSQYSYISFLAGENEPGVTTIKDELAQFFSRTGTGERKIRT